MENLETLVKKIIEFLGFSDFRVDFKTDEKRGSVFIYDSPVLVKENLPVLVESINHILQMAAKKKFRTADFFRYKRLPPGTGKLDHGTRARGG
jgi:hypothetical protein